MVLCCPGVWLRDGGRITVKSSGAYFAFSQQSKAQEPTGVCGQCPGEGCRREGVSP